jgi:hypothetical protein
VPRPWAEHFHYPEWGPIIAGAIAAAALALVLHAFALAIGLSVSSTAPTWRDASFALVLLSGLYILLAAIAAYGLGGYLAGLMGARPTGREAALSTIHADSPVPSPSGKPETSAMLWLRW